MLFPQSLLLKHVPVTLRNERFPPFAFSSVSDLLAHPQGLITFMSPRSTAVMEPIPVCREQLERALSEMAICELIRIETGRRGGGAWWGWKLLEKDFLSRKPREKHQLESWK